MTRFGLGGRLVLWLVLGLLVIQIAFLAAWLVERRATAPAEVWTPFPAQLAAMADLMDQADPATRAVLVTAFSGTRLNATLSDTAPEAEDATRAPRLPFLEQRMRAWAEGLGDRPLRIAVPAEAAEAPLARLRGRLNPERLRIAIGLSDGQWLVVEPRRAADLRLGPPPGLYAGLAATLVALVLAAMVWRETRPLRVLGAAADRFGRTLDPVPVPEAGAPDLRALARAFNAMQGQVARMDRARADMLAALAHDIRTPLTRLRLRLAALPEAQAAAVDADIAAVTRVADAAADFATADLAALAATVDLRVLAGQATDRAGIAPPGGPAGPVLSAGNAALLARALDNLIANAQAHARTVTLTVVPGADRHALHVDDDGPGIPPADRARLVEPFARGDAARTSTGGLGLGLALVDRIARRHGGRLVLGDAPAGGLRATLDLPAAATPSTDRPPLPISAVS